MLGRRAAVWYDAGCSLNIVYIRLTMKNMKSLAKICLVLVTAATLAAFTTQAQTNSMTSDTNKPPGAAAKPRAKRYAGTITSVDKDAKTITLTLASGASLTVHVTSATRIRKDGEPGVFADAVVGQKVRGSYRQDESGNWVAFTAIIGEPKMNPAAPPAPAPKQ